MTKKQSIKAKKLTGGTNLTTQRLVQPTPMKPKTNTKKIISFILILIIILLLI